ALLGSLGVFCCQTIFKEQAIWRCAERFGTDVPPPPLPGDRLWCRCCCRRVAVSNTDVCDPKAKSPLRQLPALAARISGPKKSSPKKVVVDIVCAAPEPNPSIRAGGYPLSKHHGEVVRRNRLQPTRYLPVGSSDHGSRATLPARSSR